MKGDHMRSAGILVIDDDESIREGCGRILEEAGYRVEVSPDASGGIEKVAGGCCDVVLLDLRLPDMTGIEAISKIRQKDAGAVIVIITGFPTIASVVDAIKGGAFDYIPKPFTPDQLLFHVERAAGKRFEDERAENLRRRLERSREEVRIVACSEAMKEVMRLAEKVAASESTVLITGESGAGKEVIARRIHSMSARKEAEFVAVDCSALVEGLIESELFGHVKGAFTGAWRSTRGCMEIASGGTFFFDEVSNLSPSVQSKILRTIQEKEIRRVGEARPISVDVRILAATNRDLEEEVRRGSFREDLFYRLNVFPVRVPPLRERREDILPLARDFLETFAARKRKIISDFGSDSRNFLLSYRWPGNVRELKNVVERAVIVEESEKVTLRSMLIDSGGAAVKREEARDGEPMLLREAEARHVLMVLRLSGWNKEKASRRLGIDKKTLTSKIRRYDLKP